MTQSIRKPHVIRFGVLGFPRKFNDGFWLVHFRILAIVREYTTGTRDWHTSQLLTRSSPNISGYVKYSLIFGILQCRLIISTSSLCGFVSSRTALTGIKCRQVVPKHSVAYYSWPDTLARFTCSAMFAWNTTLMRSMIRVTWGIQGYGK